MTQPPGVAMVGAGFGLGRVAWLLLHLYALVGLRKLLLVVRIICRARQRDKVTEE